MIGFMLTWRILPGLPGTGPLPKQYSATGMGTHSEGFVVEFTSEKGECWIGNFQRGLSNASAVYREPGTRNPIVLAGGTAYVVDPTTRNLVRTFGGQIQVVLDDVERGQLVFGDGLWFEAVGCEGSRWRTRRLSWDGMRSVRVEGPRILGEAYSPVDQDAWHPFEVDLTDGSSTGGSYRGPPE
jgi:hypothetical protein